MSFQHRATPRSSRAVLALLGAWFGVAIAVGATGLLARSPVPPPAIALTLTVLTSLTVWLVPAARAQARAIGRRWMVAFHATRIMAGTYFLVLYARGLLPPEFALPAGLGDIAVGVTALLVCWWCFPLRSAAQRWTLLTWNAFGLVDILGVLGNGIRLFISDPALAQPFTTLPLALLPLFIVPLVIVSHLLLFAWRNDPLD